MMGKLKGKITIGLTERDIEEIKKSPLTFTYQGFEVTVKILKGNDAYTFHNEEK